MEVKAGLAGGRGTCGEEKAASVGGKDVAVDEEKHGLYQHNLDDLDWGFPLKYEPLKCPYDVD